ncbi:aminotransferase [Marinobacterium nitratireducens]|uniref:Aminotransferase n=1 Tax=Marinobacterium nitratireducens TaxID=518897 RepID=A0A917ZNT3_9GAMM|nr:type 1 glutamine amidotransferase [Marinobacterium nitratireducens]GGO88212.1 aminotransferase [Marinobacterium nitratireducens]
MQTAKERSDLKLLLLQIRTERKVREEEHRSFASYCGLALEQIEVLNVFDTPSFADNVADGYDALLVGGASEANVLEPERYTFVHDSQRLLRRVVETRQPTFASCFGFQLVVLALGGRVAHRETGFEMGTLPISLTPDAATDPLFHDTPDGFAAVSVHRQYTDRLPPGCRLLAYTDQCLHAIRVGDCPFWAFQFHPEVDKATLVERLTHYRAHYTDGDDHLGKVLATAQETPESNGLMRKFVDRVLLGDSVPLPASGAVAAAHKR